jgi:hypothetical protein
MFLWFLLGGTAHFAATNLETTIVPPYIPWRRGCSAGKRPSLSFSVQSVSPIIRRGVLPALASLLYHGRNTRAHLYAAVP